MPCEAPTLATTFFWTFCNTSDTERVCVLDAVIKLKRRSLSFSSAVRARARSSTRTTIAMPSETISKWSKAILSSMSGLCGHDGRSSPFNPFKRNNTAINCAPCPLLFLDERQRSHHDVKLRKVKTLEVNQLMPESAGGDNLVSK